jgi:hypothetical protein
MQVLVARLQNVFAFHEFAVNGVLARPSRREMVRGMNVCLTDLLMTFSADCIAHVVSPLLVLALGAAVSLRGSRTISAAGQRAYDSG